MAKRITHADKDSWNIHINYRPRRGHFGEEESELLRRRLGEEKTLTSPSVIGSIVLLTQITIMMALLCQESGRQKAGNGWESRKGSGEACGGERREKGCVCVCVSPGQGRETREGQGATNRHLLYVSVSRQAESPEESLKSGRRCFRFVLCQLCDSYEEQRRRKPGWMCCYLLHSERRADLLSSEDHGALGQHLRQLEGVQAEQLADVTDH